MCDSALGLKRNRDQIHTILTILFIRIFRLRKSLQFLNKKDVAAMGKSSLTRIVAFRFLVIKILWYFHFNTINVSFLS